MRKLLIFGAGELQESLIQNCRDIGISAIAIDPNPNAYAKDSVDKFFVVNGDDFNQTCKIIEDNKINGIITTATDKPLKMMAKVAAKYNFPFLSESAAEYSTNKYFMKRKFIENNVPCANGNIFTSKFELSNIKFNYPVIIKPTDSSGSRGVYKCNDFNELDNYFDQVKSISSDGNVLVEEYLIGNEISVEGLVYINQLYIIQFTDKIVSLPPYNVEMGHIQPASLTKKLKSKIKLILEKATNALELNNCGFHAELKLTKDGPKIIEIGARLGGDFISSHLVPLSTGVNMEKCLCSISLGSSPNINIIKKKVSMIKYFEFKKGIVQAIADLTDLFANKKIKFFKLDLEIGKCLNLITDSLNRHGKIIISANSRKEAIFISETITDKLKERIIIK